MRAGSNPLLTDIARREVIDLECNRGRQVQVAPYKLIDQYDGVRPTTPVWNLKGRFKCKVCKTRPPKRMWIDRWLDRGGAEKAVASFMDARQGSL